MTEVVERLPSKRETLSSNSNTEKKKRIKTQFTDEEGEGHSK
jgi:hypothetical protein